MKPSLRQSILLRSVGRLLGDDEQVRSAVVMSSRHRWFVPYAIASAVALYVVASATGVESQFNQLVLALCGAALAAMATTNHTVLAETDRGLILCRSSRIRQYATAIERRLPVGTALTMVASTVITSDWRVDGIIYTLTKRWEATMRTMATDSV